MDRRQQAALLTRSRAGDGDAFQALVREELPRIRRFARAFCHDSADADDLAQEALVKAFAAMASYRSEARFSTWLYRIVRNCMVDRTRAAHYRRRSHQDPYEDDGRSTRSEDRPDTALERARLRQHLWDALGRISPEFRTAIVLFDVEGLSQEEIAEIEEIAIGTVKSRLARGRRQLREILIGKGVLPAADKAVEATRNQPGPGLVSPQRSKS